MATSTIPAKRGRPPRENASSHHQILDAVIALLQKMPARDVSMEQIARRAGVGKPTLYKWWPSRTALLLAAFRERMDVGSSEEAAPPNAQEFLHQSLRSLTEAFSSFFGKFMADLVAEAQADPALLKEFYIEHVAPRRAASKEIIESGIEQGELRAGTDPDILIDALYGAVYYRLLLKSGPLDQAFAQRLVEQTLRGCLVHAPKGK